MSAHPSNGQGSSALNVDEIVQSLKDCMMTISLPEGSDKTIDSLLKEFDPCLDGFREKAHQLIDRADATQTQLEAQRQAYANLVENVLLHEIFRPDDKAGDMQAFERHIEGYRRLISISIVMSNEKILDYAIYFNRHVSHLVKSVDDYRKQIKGNVNQVLELMNASQKKAQGTPKADELQSDINFYKTYAKALLNSPAWTDPSNSRPSLEL